MQPTSQRGFNGPRSGWDFFRRQATIDDLVDPFGKCLGFPACTAVLGGILRRGHTRRDTQKQRDQTNSPCEATTHSSGLLDTCPCPWRSANEDERPSQVERDQRT